MIECGHEQPEYCDYCGKILLEDHHIEPDYSTDGEPIIRCFCDKECYRELIKLTFEEENESAKLKIRFKYIKDINAHQIYRGKYWCDTIYYSFNDKQWKMSRNKDNLLSELEQIVDFMKSLDHPKKNAKLKKESQVMSDDVRLDMSDMPGDDAEESYET